MTIQNDGKLNIRIDEWCYWAGPVPYLVVRCYARMRETHDGTADGLRHPLVTSFTPSFSSPSPQDVIKWPLTPKTTWVCTYIVTISIYIYGYRDYTFELYDTKMDESVYDAFNISGFFVPHIIRFNSKLCELLKHLNFWSCIYLKLKFKQLIINLERLWVYYSKFEL